MFYRHLFRIISALFIFILFQTGTALPANPSASQRPDSLNVTAKDTFDVSEAKMLIIYPKGKLLYKEPHCPNEKNRGGSFVSVNFLIQYENVALQEILFHTFASCSVFAPGWEKAVAESGYNDGEGFTERVYSPDAFAKQHLAFQNKDSLPGYDLITINKVNYYYSCRYYEPGGAYSIQTMTFMGDIRIMIVMFSSYLHNCDKVYEECKNLLSKIEIKPYQPKKK